MLSPGSLLVISGPTVHDRLSHNEPMQSSFASSLKLIYADLKSYDHGVFQRLVGAGGDEYGAAPNLLATPEAS